MTKFIAVLSAALMVVCFIPSTFAAQDTIQRNSMNRAMHPEMNTTWSANFSHENESFGTQQERILEQINNTISKIKADAANSDGLENKNITTEMLDNATTQLEDAKTLVKSAENVDDLKVAMEKVHTAMEELGIRPQDGPEMRREMMGNATGNATAFGNESFETQQERMLEQINNTISKIKADAANVDRLENKNITAEMLNTALTKFEEVKTIITNAENVDDLKEAMEKVHTAMEELGIRPENEKGMERGPMGKPRMFPQNETSKA